MNIPSEWIKKIELVLSQLSSSGNTDELCHLQRECQTITSLSDYVQNGTQETITFSDENGSPNRRTVDISLIISHLFDDIDASCITNNWQNLTLKERIQLIIDDCCYCCNPTTTTSSTTTTTTVSEDTTTTSTTTVAPATTTTTTAVTSTTTTTTAAFEVNISNSLDGSSITQVNNILGFIPNPSLPINSGDASTGMHGVFTGAIQLVIGGPPDFDGIAILRRNLITLGFINVLVSDSYPKTINFGSFSYADSDLIEIELI